MNATLRTALAAGTIFVGSLAFGSGLAAAAGMHDEPNHHNNNHHDNIDHDNNHHDDDHRPQKEFYVSVGVDPRCETFVEDANRSLSLHNDARARQIVSTADDRGCILILVTS